MAPKPDSTEQEDQETSASPDLYEREGQRRPQSLSSASTQYIDTVESMRFPPSPAPSAPPSEAGSGYSRSNTDETEFSQPRTPTDSMMLDSIEHDTPEVVMSDGLANLQSNTTTTTAPAAPDSHDGSNNSNSQRGDTSRHLRSESGGGVSKRLVTQEFRTHRNGVRVDKLSSMLKAKFPQGGWRARMMCDTYTLEVPEELTAAELESCC